MRRFLGWRRLAIERGLRGTVSLVHRPSYRTIALHDAADPVERIAQIVLRAGCAWHERQAAPGSTLPPGVVGPSLTELYCSPENGEGRATGNFVQAAQVFG